MITKLHIKKIIASCSRSVQEDEIELGKVDSFEGFLMECIEKPADKLSVVGGNADAIATTNSGETSRRANVTNLPAWMTENKKKGVSLKETSQMEIDYSNPRTSNDGSIWRDKTSENRHKSQISPQRSHDGTGGGDDWWQRDKEDFNDGSRSMSPSSPQRPQRPQRGQPSPPRHRSNGGTDWDVVSEFFDDVRREATENPGQIFSTFFANLRKNNRKYIHAGKCHPPAFSKAKEALLAAEKNGFCVIEWQNKDHNHDNFAKVMPPRLSKGLSRAAHTQSARERCEQSRQRLRQQNQDVHVEQSRQRLRQQNQDPYDDDNVFNDNENYRRNSRDTMMMRDGGRNNDREFNRNMSYNSNDRESYDDNPNNSYDNNPNNRSNHDNKRSKKKKKSAPRCTFYNKGKCRMGDECRFSHDFEPSHWATYGGNPYGDNRRR